MSSLACDGCIEAIDAQLGEAADVLLADDLGVLDPQPGIARLGDGLPGRGVGVEHQGVPLVADGVGGDLPAVAQGRGRRRLEDLGLDQEQPGVPRVVASTGEQQAAARAHRAVDEELDGPHLESGAFGAGLRAVG